MIEGRDARIRRLYEDERLRANGPGRELIGVLLTPTGTSSAGYAYLERPAFERVRDWVPHVYQHGPGVLSALDTLLEVIQEHDAPSLESAKRAARVVRQIVRTAAVTAPPDCWLLRHVLSTFRRLGVLEDLVSGATIGGKATDFVRCELEVDLSLLLSRGFLVRQGSGYRASGHRTTMDVLERISAVPDGTPAGLAPVWRVAFEGGRLGEVERQWLDRMVSPLPASEPSTPPTWIPSLGEIERGYRLVPCIVGLQASGRSAELLAMDSLNGGSCIPGDERIGKQLCAFFVQVGVLDANHRWTSVGRRVVERGPGPFGIIAAYAPYMDELERILRHGRQAVHLSRGENIAASQEANRGTFERANNALDRFCTDTGFAIEVFVEHAVGRGEATRQRFLRSGGVGVRYFGADLEDAAIDGAIEEQRAGRLPEEMVFVRRADIGDPDRLLEAIRAAGCKTEGAVMIVGNGFHEVRNQSDQRLVEIFSAYEDAGLILLFTEESALSVDDLLQTAWNTYHAGFKYVHERSGQGLRPARQAPPSRLGGDVRASWHECAARAGYVRVSEYCDRSRTIYPYTPVSGHNPSISENHFCLPARLAERFNMAG